MKLINLKIRMPWNNLPNLIVCPAPVVLRTQPNYKTKNVYEKVWDSVEFTRPIRNGTIRFS
jgi:hypothetical protein